jgi:selenide,water dikinase
MVAIGLADPERIVRNSTARRGDRLFLTKPIGLGIVSTAVKRAVADEGLVSRAVELMTTLNDRAAEAMLEAGANAATDVTGFGLLGHLHRMLAASGVAARVDASEVPVIDGVLALARDGVVPGGTGRNHAFVDPHVDWGLLERPEQMVLADAQTSGGLLVATADAERLTAALRAREVSFAEVGEIVAGPAGRIVVTGRLGAG